MASIKYWSELNENFIKNASIYDILSSLQNMVGAVFAHSRSVSKSDYIFSCIDYLGAVFHKSDLCLRSSDFKSKSCRCCDDLTWQNAVQCNVNGTSTFTTKAPNRSYFPFIRRHKYETLYFHVHNLTGNTSRFVRSRDWMENFIPSVCACLGEEC
jgi:hypothetical protein